MTLTAARLQSGAKPVKFGCVPACSRALRNSTPKASAALRRIRPGPSHGTDRPVCVRAKRRSRGRCSLQRRVPIPESALPKTVTGWPIIDRGRSRSRPLYVLGPGSYDPRVARWRDQGGQRRGRLGDRTGPLECQRRGGPERVGLAWLAQRNAPQLRYRGQQTFRRRQAPPGTELSISPFSNPSA